jgi:hypothetical protein
MAQIDVAPSFEPCADGQVAGVYVTPTPELRKIERGNARSIPWARPDGKNGKGKVRWVRLTEQAIYLLQRAAAHPHSAAARQIFPDSTILPGRPRDGRTRADRMRRVRSEARVNTANVMSVILGWSDLASGLVAEKPKPGTTGWQLKAWDDVGSVAFGDDIEGALCVEKRTQRAVERLVALGYIQVTQIRERDGEEWRSKVAVKRVTQLFWARLGLIRDLFAWIESKKQERRQRQAEAREAAQNAGERARQRGEAPAPQSQAQSPSALTGQHRVDEGPPGKRELPKVALDLGKFLGIEPEST